MTRSIICKVCREREFDKEENKYGYRPTYLWNEPYTHRAYIKKSIRVKDYSQKNMKYKTKWIAIGYFCEVCGTFIPDYFKFPRLRLSMTTQRRQ